MPIDLLVGPQDLTQLRAALNDLINQINQVSMLQTPGGQQAVTQASANFQVVIPAGGVLLAIIVEETSGHAMIEGITIGTSPGDDDVGGPVAIGANDLLNLVAEGAILKTIFSTSLPQTLYFSSADWGSAKVNIYTIYSGVAV